MFGSSEKHSLADGIFADYVNGSVVGQAGGDFFPGLAAIVGAIDVRVQIVEAETIDCGVHAVGIEVRSVQLRDFTPGGEVGRRNFAPVLAAVAREPDEAVVGAGPDDVGVERRGREGINYAAMFALRWVVRDHAG